MDRRHDVVTRISLSAELIDLLFIEGKTEELVLEDVATFQADGWSPLGTYPQVVASKSYRFGAVLRRHYVPSLVDYTVNTEVAA